jgi:hypothetical protein
VRSDHDRQKLIEVIEAYVSEKTGSFEFDDELDSLMDSKDATVRQIAFDLWMYYDDVIDHKIHGPAEVWDLFQRYLLVLRVGLDVQRGLEWVWGWWQACAAVMVVLYLAMLPRNLDWTIVLLGIPFGIASIVIGRWKKMVIWGTAGKNAMLVPFASDDEMKRVMERCPELTIAPCPQHIADRKVRSRLSEFVTLLPSLFLQLCLGPLCLMWQSLPYKYEYSRVISKDESPLLGQVSK